MIHQIYASLYEISCAVPEKNIRGYTLLFQHRLEDYLPPALLKDPQQPIWVLEDLHFFVDDGDACATPEQYDICYKLFLDAMAAELKRFAQEQGAPHFYTHFDWYRHMETEGIGGWQYAWVLGLPQEPKDWLACLGMDHHASLSIP